MRTKNGRVASRSIAAGVAFAVAVATAPAARADDTERVKELEERLAQMEELLEDIRTTDRGGYAVGYASELEARVAELEKATDKDGKGLFWTGVGGFKGQTLDKKTKIQFGGRVMNDYVFWSSDRDTEAVVGDELTTGTEFRRARLFMAGQVYGNVIFKAQFDFGGGDADFKDVYVGLVNGNGGTWKVGHHHEPVGLEEQTSSKYITFMERAMHNAAFNPARSTGLSYGRGGKLGDDGADYVYRFGVFRESNDYGDDKGSAGHGEWNISGRIAGRPYVSEDGETFFHAGVSGTHKKFADQMARFRARPEVHMSPRFVDTGSFGSDDGNIIGLESGFASGSFHAQAEYFMADVDVIGDSSAGFDGWSVQAGVFLTGESRPYKGGKWGRVKPKTNYDGEGGSGAWEIAGRFSTLDLNDGAIMGGEVDVITLGLNWYLNPQTRVMLNVQDIDLDRGDADDVQVVQVRFQIDF